MKQILKLCIQFLRVEHYYLPKVVSLKMDTTLNEKWPYFLPS